MSIILQGFNWMSHKNPSYYNHLQNQTPKMTKMNINKLWLPPCSKSYDPEGYNPCDYYDLHSEYGNKYELSDLVKFGNDCNIDSIADIVCWSCFGNHCKSHYTFNFRRRIVSDPMIFQEFLHYIRYLSEDLEFKGLRFDYLKAEPCKSLCKYITESGHMNDSFIVGELWESMNYTGSYLDYDQDKHRKQIVNYIDGIDQPVHMFDFTLKGILQEAITKNEYWRLQDSQGKSPGVSGWWPERSVTFIDNHDTLGQYHWPFSFREEDVVAGYAYIFTHPGNPCIYIDHFVQYYETLLKLSEICQEYSPKTVDILCANDKGYCAKINDTLYVCIGDVECPGTKELFSYGKVRIYE